MATTRTRPTAEEQRFRRWEQLKDLATPCERYWIDLWAKLTQWRDGSLYKITEREGPHDGQFVWLCCYSRRPPGMAHMPIVFEYIVAKAMEAEREENIEKQNQADREAGAFI
jgi:hypothetical protein